MKRKYNKWQKYRPNGFVTDLSDAIISRIGDRVNNDYIITSCESFSSGFMHDIYLTDNDGKLRPQKWDVGIARSGEGKTNVIDYLRSILRRVEKEIIESMGVTKKVRIYSSGSPRGLLESMNYHSEKRFNEDEEEMEKITVKRNKGVLIRDEFTEIINGMVNKQWMSNFKETFSLIWDGHLGSDFTRSHGGYPSTNCQVSLVTATTPYIYNVLDESLFEQGLFNRIDWIVWEPSDVIPDKRGRDYFATDPIDIAKIEMEKQLFTDTIVDLMDANEDNEADTITMTGGAKDLCNDYEHEIERRKRELGEGGKTPILWANLSRQAEKALRTASIYAVSRRMNSIHKHIGSGARGFQVDENIMKYAIFRQERCYHYFKKMVRKWSMKTKSWDAKTDADMKSMVYNIIKKDEEIDRSSLLRKSELKSDRLDDIIITLKEEFRVKRKIEGQGKVGRNKTIYVDIG